MTIIHRTLYTWALPIEKGCWTSKSIGTYNEFCVPWVSLKVSRLKHESTGIYSLAHHLIKNCIMRGMQQVLSDVVRFISLWNLIKYLVKIHFFTKYFIRFHIWSDIETANYCPLDKPAYCSQSQHNLVLKMIKYCWWKLCSHFHKI